MHRYVAYFGMDGGWLNKNVRNWRVLCRLEESAPPRHYGTKLDAKEGKMRILRDDLRVWVGWPGSRYCRSSWRCAAPGMNKKRIEPQRAQRTTGR